MSSHRHRRQALYSVDDAMALHANVLGLVDENNPDASTEDLVLQMLLAVVYMQAAQVHAILATIDDE